MSFCNIFGADDPFSDNHIIDIFIQGTFENMNVVNYEFDISMIYQRKNVIYHLEINLMIY